MVRTAHLEENRYSSGRRFWLVLCDECGVVLNSGHHYDDRGLSENRAIAQEIADRHNRLRHAVRASEHEPVSEHAFDLDDGWCHAHRDYCNMAKAEIGGQP